MRATLNRSPERALSVRRSLGFVVVAAILLAGCAGPQAPSKTAAVRPAQAQGTPATAVLARLDPGLGYGADVLCLQGGAAEIRRVQGTWISEGHHALRITIDAPPSSTGVQIGVKLDKGEIKWLPVAFNEKVVQRVPLVGDFAETNATQRWTFYFSQDIKGAEQGCYTGATLFQETVEIAAVADA